MWSGRNLHRGGLPALTSLAQAVRRFFADSSNGAPVVGSWTYSHDALNRLAGSQEQGSQPVNPMTNYCWSYDAFGNRTSQDAATSPFQSGFGGASPCLPANPPPISYNANNQINGGPVVAVYDAAGDITNDGKNQYPCSWFLEFQQFCVSVSHGEREASQSPLLA